MKNNIQITIIISGKGKSKIEAFSNALREIQKKILSEQHNSVLLKIEPINLTVINAYKETKIEKFLFLLFPREINTYYVQLSVELIVTNFNINNIEFIQK